MPVLVINVGEGLFGSSRLGTGPSALSLEGRQEDVSTHAVKLTGVRQVAVRTFPL